MRPDLCYFYSRMFLICLNYVEFCAYAQCPVLISPSEIQRDPGRYILSQPHSNSKFLKLKHVSNSLLKWKWWWKQTSTILNFNFAFQIHVVLFALLLCSITMRTNIILVEWFKTKKKKSPLHKTRANTTGSDHLGPKIGMRVNILVSSYVGRGETAGYRISYTVQHKWNRLRQFWTWNLTWPIVLYISHKERGHRVSKLTSTKIKSGQVCQFWIRNFRVREWALHSSMLCHLRRKMGCT